MSNQSAQQPAIAAVPPPDSGRTCTAKQMSAERKAAGADFSSTIGLATSAHGGATQVGKSLGISGDAVEQWGDPVHPAALTFRDGIAAARKGGREWARSIGVAYLQAVGEGAPVADVSPLRHAVWIGSAVGELQRRIDDALEDDELDTDEARVLLKELAHVDARLAGFKRLLDAKARTR